MQICEKSQNYKWYKMPLTFQVGCFCWRAGRYRVRSDRELEDTSIEGVVSYEWWHV